MVKAYKKSSSLNKKTHSKNRHHPRKKSGFQKLLTAEGWKQLMTGKKR
jgi:hypothetical protein